MEAADENPRSSPRGEVQAVVDDELLSQDNQHEDADKADAEHVGDDPMHHRFVHVLHSNSNQHQPSEEGTQAPDPLAGRLVMLGRDRNH